MSSSEMKGRAWHGAFLAVIAWFTSCIRCSIVEEYADFVRGRYANARWFCGIVKTFSSLLAYDGFDVEGGWIFYFAYQASFLQMLCLNMLHIYVAKLDELQPMNSGQQTTLNSYCKLRKDTDVLVMYNSCLWRGRVMITFWYEDLTIKKEARP
ncbi:hypothetical protein VNO80_21803 [Phaseolus coccineus]|uniref:Uncharacterized protein n=1 Tax=Phaseolus coccineus TaxID=3886 RepID=A0AAN9M312_PHACN